MGSSISDEKYKHLNNFIVNWKLNQLTVIIQDWADNGRTGQGKALPACMTSLKDEEILDLSAALARYMDKEFPLLTSEFELRKGIVRPHADAKDYFPWIQSLPPEQRILFEDEMQLFYFTIYGHSFDVRGAIEDGTLNRRLNAGPLVPTLAGQDYHEDTSVKDVCQVKEIDDPDSEMMGKYFSLYEQSNTKTVIYQIDKVALPGEHRWIFYPERLDSTIEFLDGVCDGTTCYEFGTKKRTFYVAHPAPEGNPVAIFHFIEGKGVMMNMGFWGGDRFLISKSPIILNYKKIGRADSVFNDSNIEHFGGYSAFQVCEEMEYDYSSLGDRRIVILDGDTTEEVRPYFDFPGNKGKIKLTLHKKYMSFEIRSKYKHDPSMSDYEIGCAYRYGTYRLNRNYEKALYHFRLAEAAGDVRAKAELVKMYEKGMGCSQNPEVIKRLKREIQQI